MVLAVGAGGQAEAPAEAGPDALVRCVPTAGDGPATGPTPTMTRELGEPICPDCYDYPAAVAFNWQAPELWRRFMIGLRRRLAAQLGMTEAALGRTLRVSYAKVAEFQRRGVVHFHAIIRVDGAGDGYPPATVTLTDEEFTAAVRAAAGEATVAATLSATCKVRLGLGEQIDIRPLRHDTNDQVADDDTPDGLDGPVTTGMVAAYIAKYATKAAEDFGLDSTVRTAAMAERAGLRPHVAAMILTAEQLSELPEYAGLLRWVHMLGFRGHFTTKSRKFSVTLGSLRQARRDYRAAHIDDAAHMTSSHPMRLDRIPRCPSGRTRIRNRVCGTTKHSQQICKRHDGLEEEVIPVVGEWRFLGLGYTTPGDALLAAYEHADHLAALEFLRQEART